MRAFPLAILTVDSALPIFLRRRSLLRVLRRWRELRWSRKILHSTAALLESVVQRLDIPVSTGLQRRCTRVRLHYFLRRNFPAWQRLGP